MRQRKFGLVFAAIAMLFAATPALASEPLRVPVEVWAAAHDELTNRLSAAISVALNDSPTYASSVGKKPGSLYITITRRVHWKIMGPRAMLDTPIAIAKRPPNAAPVLARTVVCRDDLLQTCASQVLVLLGAISTERAARPAPRPVQTGRVALALNATH